MVWRGSPKGKDKFFACLTYLVPLIEIIPFGGYLFSIFPPLVLPFIPLSYLLPIYYWGAGGFSIVAIAVFIGLYAGVAQNRRLIHFLRYNAMQALLLSVFAWLCRLVLTFLGFSEQIFFQGIAGSLSETSSLATDAILSIIFIFIAGSSFYSIFQCIRGLYAEIPIISEAAHSQVRY